MMKARTLIGLYLTLCIFTAMGATGCRQVGGSTPSQNNDRIFAKWDRPDSPGAAVIVLKDGLVTNSRGYGTANLENGTSITTSTVFEVGSVAKQFTAFAIALLAAQGKISLDEDIRIYVPEVPDFGHKLTIRQLIHHTSGLRNWEVLFKLAGNEGAVTSRQVLDVVARQKELNFKPGAEYSYCNTGYLLLAEAVARITGRTFPEWTRAHIFDPLGMADTRFQDDPARLPQNRATGYYRNQGGEFRAATYTWAVPGPTSLFTTAEDLAKWMQNFDDKRLGGPSVVDRMFQQGVLDGGTRIDYAFGLVIGTRKGLRKISHEGGWSGFRSVVTLYPEQNLGVAILSNMGLGVFSPSPLADKVADLYLSNKLQDAESAPKKVVKINPNLYDAYTGKYLLPLPYNKPKVVTISTKDDRLWGEMEGLPQRELLPLSKNTFHTKDSDIKLFFINDENGNITGFSTVLGSGKRLLPSGRLVTLNAHQLEAYNGEYRSPELSTTWKIQIHGNQLKATHEFQKSVRLTPIAGDRFVGDQWWFQQITFIRDGRGRITSFRLSAEDGLVRNLLFQKQYE